MNVDLRLLPVALAAWLGAAAGLLIDLRWACGAAVGAVIVVLLVRAPKIRASLGAGAATLVIAALSASQLAGGPVARLAKERAIVILEAKLDSDVQLTAAHDFLPAMARVRATTVWVQGRGERVDQRVSITLSVSGSGVDDLVGLPAGTRVQVQARLESVDRWTPTAAEARVRGELHAMAEPDWGARVVNAIRGGLRDAMRHSSPDQAGLVPSLVVGDTSRLADDLVDAFKATGLTHLTAVSGTNLTLMLGFLVVVCGWTRVMGWPRRGLQVAGVAGLVVLCRGEPSVLRAAAMGVVGLAALGVGGRGARGLRHLSVAVIVLCLIDPWLALTWGFALSVAASAGILWWGGPWQRRMRAWAPGWLAEALAIPLAAQVATQPLICALSGQVSLVGIIANALVGPFVGPVTVLGLLAALLCAVPVLASIAGWLAGWCVQPIIWVARLGAETPAGTREVGSGWWVVVLAVVACLLAARALAWLLARSGATIGLVMALLAASLWRAPVVGWPGDWRVISCDVGQGDATLIRAGPAAAMMVDVGPAAGDAVGCLRDAGVSEIPLLVLTHYHADHIGALAEVMDAVTVRVVLVSGVTSTAGAWAQGLARDHGAQVKVSGVGDRWVTGDASWVTAGAAELVVDTSSNEGESEAENDASLVGIATSGGVSLLIAGDAEPPGQRAARASGVPLVATVFKLPHHGSSNQDEAFFKASGASVALASAGRGNPYGHPAARTVRLAESLGMRVFRTDQQGSIAVGVGTDGLTVRTRGVRK